MSYFIAGLSQNFACFGNDNIISQEFAKNFLFSNFVIRQSIIGQLLSRTSRQFFTGFPNGFTCFGINQIKIKFNTFQASRLKFNFPIFFRSLISIDIIEIMQNFFFIHTLNFGRVNMFPLFGQFCNFIFRFFRIQRIQNRSNRQFTTTVNTRINQVFGIKFEIKPRTAIRNNSGCKQIFTGRNGLTLIMVKENTRRTVHLRNNNTLRSVKNKGSLIRHQRNIAHINILLLDVMDRFGSGSLISIPNNQAQRRLNGRRISHISFDTFINIIFRCLEFIFNKLQFAVSGKIFNRKNRFENFFQTEFTFFGTIGLNKIVIRTGLNFD